MNWLCLLYLTVLTEAGNQYSSDELRSTSRYSDEATQFNPALTKKARERSLLDTGKPQPTFTKWSAWSSCNAGHKTRRKHCLQPRICNDSLRIEVASCRLHDFTRHHSLHDKRQKVLKTRQMNHAADIQKRFRGFSPWSPWSTCSRRCTTVRRRYCRRAALCGRKVIRQSSYCYVEGGFCHRWIKGKMQRRKDPGYTVVESLPSPELAIHPEDTRPSHPDPVCGKIGRYYGSAANRLRARMNEMKRIIGGRPAPAGKWPWQVVVLNRYKEAFCGGTLVSLRWVVTAAHCVRKRLFVRLGEHDLALPDRAELEMRVVEAVVHPQYDPDTVVNDVAMLRLPEAARPEMGHAVACLPEENSVLPPFTTCTILGWGKRRATDVHGTRILHEAQVSTIQQGVCRRSYWQYAITDNMVCAGRGRRDSCAGDSGGPLLCREQAQYYLQGITSFGDGCGKRGKYGIYTRTAGYVGWMKKVMNHKYFDD